MKKFRTDYYPCFGSPRCRLTKHFPEGLPKPNEGTDVFYDHLSDFRLSISKCVAGKCRVCRPVIDVLNDEDKEVPSAIITLY